jgi:hypothetical protein
MGSNRVSEVTVSKLTPAERLIWLLGDLMNNVENYFGAPNPKRLGHIDAAAARILDEVVAPLEASIRQHTIEKCAAVVDQCNREGPYNAIGAGSRIRALLKQEVLL